MKKLIISTILIMICFISFGQGPPPPPPPPPGGCVVCVPIDGGVVVLVVLAVLLGISKFIYFFINCDTILADSKHNGIPPPG